MFVSILRTALFASVAVASASATLTTTTEASAAPQVRTVKLRNLDKPMVPTQVVAGDREFGGNGPDITCKATLSITADQRAILATVDFKARETKADWSETRGSWTTEVYRVEKGKKILSITDGASSVVAFRSDPAGFQLLAPTQDWLAVLKDLEKVHNALLKFAAPGAPQPHTAAERELKKLSDEVISKNGYLFFQGNKVYLETPPTGPVSVFGIVGDTGGPDISTDEDPKDDTRVVSVKFKPIKIRVE
jgi:hypothetical protein